MADSARTGDLVLEIHEKLLNRIIHRTDQRQSPVRDFVLGADVHGVESTTTTIQVDLQPSSEGVALELVLRGQSRSETVGYTPQAAVRTLGQHQFTATKPVLHDGRLFRTERPRVDVSPSNQTLGVATPVSGVPILGDFASSIGFQAAESQRLQGEMIAAQKIRDGVGTEFNRQIDEQLAQLNRGWINQFAPQLKRHGFDDIRITAQSSDAWARYTVNLPRRGIRESVVPRRVQRPVSRRIVPVRRISQVAQTAANDAPLAGRIAIRDDLVNNLFDRLGLAGSTFRAAEFVEPATIALQVLDDLRSYGLEVAEIPPEAVAALQSLTIRFDERTPLRVEFQTDEVVLRARAALAVPPLIDLPLAQITLRYRIDDRGDGAISLAPAGMTLRPTDANGPALGPLALLLESQATAALPEIRLPRDFNVPIPDSQPLQITIDDLRSEDGRLTLTAR